MAKKKQFVTAAAAFAVAASAVAPAITADAASSTVRLSSDYVRGGNLDAALDKEYKGSEIYWYKSSIDLNKLGVFQTAKGFVKGKGIKVEKKLRVLNYAQEVKPAKEIVLEQGVPASGLRIQPVLFADGNLYDKPVSVQGFNTDKVGEFEGSFTYANKAFGSVTTKVKYKVVATKVELSEVKSEVMDDVLSVTADVKNLKEGEKVELVVYANRDMNAALPAVQAEVKDGKLSVKSAKLPAGNHSFILRSGEVKTEAMNFVVEAPMVKEVKAINATQVLVKFNKELDKDTAENEANYKVNNEALSAPATVAELQEDKKSVVITLASSKNKTSFTFGVEGVKTADLKAVESFTSTVAVDDVTNPEVKSVSIASNGNLEIAFSEPLKNINPIVRVGGQPVVITNVNAGDTKVVVPAANYTIASGATASVYVAGAQDTVGNEMNLFNGSVTKVADSTKPTISSIKQVGQNVVRVVFSEALGTSAADLGATEFKFLKGAALVSSTAAVKNTAVDASGKTYDVTFTESDIYGSAPSATDSASVTLLLAKDAVADLAGNTIDQYSQSFTFNADKTGPAFVSSAVALDKQTIELKFDEALLADATSPVVNNIDETKIIVTDENGVRYTVDNASTVIKGSGEDAKVLKVDFVAGSGMIANGTYTVQLQAGAVKDALGNASSAATTKVVVGDSADKTKPVATLDETSSATAPEDLLASGVNKFVVDFSEEVTGSALSLSNYKLDGASLPAGTVIYFNSTAKNSVTIELPDSSVNIGSSSTGTNALLNVSGVQDKAGNASDSTNLKVKIGDNTPAVLTSAQKLGNTLVLTFNEDLNSTTAADANLAAVLANYEIKSGSNNVVSTGTTAGVATASLVAGSNNKVQITFSTIGDSGYNAAETITVKTNSSTGDVTDANGVRVKGGVTVTAN